VPTELAASLRRPDPYGFGQRCRKGRLSGLRRFVAPVAAIVAAGALAGAVASTAFAAASPQPKPHRGSARTGHGSLNLRPLWARFPLSSRRGSPEKPAAKPSTRAGSPEKPATKSSWSPLAWIAAAAVASILLLAVVVARRRRRSRRRIALAGNDHRSPHVAAGMERSEDGVAQAAVRAEQADPDAPAPVDRPRNGYLLFVPTSTGYRLLERPGRAPPESVEFDGEEFGLQGRFRVSKIVASPLPSDERDCAYLESA
jgi:hypothetical protein